MTCRRLQCLLWGWNGRVGRWQVYLDTSVLQAEEGSVCGALALALESEGGLACRRSQLLWVPVFQDVRHIVSQALKRYSEDRIGMVDYALESGGACVCWAAGRGGQG